MAFPPSRTHELNTFVLGVLDEIDGDPTDIVSPNHPLWKRLDQNGNIEERAPGHGPVEDILYLTPSRAVDISLSQDLVEKEYKAIEGYTQAKFDWFALVETLTIPKMQLDNSTGKNAIADIVDRKKKQLDKQHKNDLVSVLFTGRSVGSERIFGIEDFNQTSTSSNPTKGSVGGIDQTLQTNWKNNVKDYNAVYKVESSGLVSSELITESATSMYKLWEACISGDKGDVEEGRPDIVACNSEAYQRYTDLVDLRLAFQNKNMDFDLGVDELYYRGAALFYDPSVSDEASTEGIMHMLNTNMFSFVFASGLRGMWGDMYAVPGRTGTAWDRSTQVSMTVRNRRAMGVIHGIKAAA